MNSVFIKLAFRNLLRHRRRTFATGLAIAAGLVGLSLLFGYISYIQNILQATSIYGNYQGHIVIVKNDSLLRFFSKPLKYSLSGKDQEAIADLLKPYQGDIELLSKEMQGMGLISKGDLSVPFQAQGIPPETDQFVKNHPFYKEWISAPRKYAETSDFYKTALTDSSVVSVTKLMGKVLAPEISSLEGLEVQLVGRNFWGDLNAVNAKIGARHSTGSTFLEETSLVTTLEQLQNLFSTDGVSRLSVFLRNANRTSSIKKELQAVIADQKLPFEVYGYDDEKLSPMYVGTMSFLFTIGFFFSVLILGAVTLSIVNSLTLGLLERLKEIGTLRAIGYTPQQINLIFIIEGTLQTVFFSALGTILSVAISVVLNNLDIRFYPPGAPAEEPFRIALSGTLCLAVFFMFLLVGITTSYFVLQRKTKFTIVELLSDSGV